jgi:CRP/FNR family transcriptional regulator
MTKLECIARIPLFQGFPQHLLRKISTFCVERTYGPGDLLCREGTKGLGLFFIVEGKVEVFGTTPSGREKRIALLGPGEVVGEMMILDRKPRSASASARAVDDVACYLMPEWDFRRLLKAYPEIAIRLLPNLAGRIRTLGDGLLG